MTFCKLSRWLVCAALLLAHCTVRATTTRYYTYEEDAPGTEIGSLSRDLKIEPTGEPQASFRFMQKPNSSAVHLRQMDGLLTVGERIDREHLCARSPLCLITFDIIVFSRDKYQLIHVEVEVKDINDNAPQFPSGEIQLDISESAPVGTRFPLDVAVDQDVGSNYIQSYEMSYNSHFGIDVRTGEDGLKYAELVLVNSLDREVEDVYAIEVTAKDGGTPAQTGLMTVNIKVLDFNDNSPTFERSSLKVELSEDAPLGFLLLKVHAFDPDEDVNGQVRYTFTPQSSAEVKRVFLIDPQTGSVTLNAPIDYETRWSYELNIQAYDLGVNSVPATCKVTVEIEDVNDNPPEITIKPMTSMSDGVAYITEAAAEESFVALISTSDKDSGSNGYVLTSLHGHEHFRLQQAYGDTFMIVTTTTLDREKIPEYNLTVVAEDLGSPPFKTIKQYTIRVSDENDNAPLFSKSNYEVSVLENNVPGSYIVTVVARDIDEGENGRVIYTLIDKRLADGAPLSTYVSVDPVSGSLYSVRSFDYESLKQLEVSIQGADHGSPQLSTRASILIRVVDQNDNTPFFTFPVLHNDTSDVLIPYNAPAGYVVIQMKARDADEGVNGDLIFKILEDELSLFAINKETGEVSLKFGLSFLCGDVLKVKIGVSDQGRSPLSARATLRFLVTEMQPSEDQIVVVLESSKEAEAAFDVSLVVIVALGGGCAVLVVAIVTVALSRWCNHKGGSRNKCDKGEGLFERTQPIKGSNNAFSSYVGPRVCVSDDATSHGGSVSRFGERSIDSETKAFFPFSTKQFEPVALWQGDKYSLQLSGTGTTDQLSVKDSGKGDSDFNDSDSDISGEGSRRSCSTFSPQSNGSFLSASTCVGNPSSRHSLIPTRPSAARGNAYTISFSQLPIHRAHHPNPAAWRGCGYCTGIPKTHGPLQSFARTGTLPPHFSQHRLETEQSSHSAGEVGALSEVATTF